jgi:hypothetical protein
MNYLQDPRNRPVSYGSACRAIRSRMVKIGEAP